MMRRLVLTIAGISCLLHIAGVAAEGIDRVVIDSDGWELVGDLQIPPGDSKVPAILMLNQAAGDRKPYENLADELAQRGIASLRLDLRAHGDSTNLGEFIPGISSSQDREVMIAGADRDVVAAHQYLISHPELDPTRIGIVGASYSGEEMAEAGHETNYARAYVVLSPGSFSDRSIEAMDTSGAAWLFIVSKNDRFLHEIVANVHEKTRSVELLYLPGEQHATNLLDDRVDLAERIATWLAAKLSL